MLKVCELNWVYWHVHESIYSLCVRKNKWFIWAPFIIDQYSLWLLFSLHYQIRLIFIFLTVVASRIACHFIKFHWVNSSRHKLLVLPNGQLIINSICDQLEHSQMGLSMDHQHLSFLNIYFQIEELFESFVLLHKGQSFILYFSTLTWSLVFF